MVLQGYFDRHVRISNHAVNGRSSKSFIDEGRWQRVLEELKPGDYVIIQFGHNDEKNDSLRHTVPGGSFDDNLRRFVRETRLRKATPILMNAVVRRNFFQASDGSAEDEALRNTKYEDEQVNSDTLIDTHGAYLLSPKRVAAETGTLFIDANRITHDLEQGLGIEGSRRLHMWYRPGEVASIPNGRHDNTHYNIYGARVVAGLLADAIVRQVPSLKKHLRHYDYVVSSEGRGNYMSLQEPLWLSPRHLPHSHMLSLSHSLRPHGLKPIKPSVHGIFQARILAWVAISYSEASTYLHVNFSMTLKTFSNIALTYVSFLSLILLSTSLQNVYHHYPLTKCH